MTVLNNNLKTELVDKVLQDQFHAPVEALKNQLKKEAALMLKHKDSGLTLKMREALNAIGVDTVNKRWINTSSMLNVSIKDRKTLKSDGYLFLKQIKPSSAPWDLKVLFTFKLTDINAGVEYALPQTSSMFAMNMTCQIKSIFELATELFESIRETQKNLVAVMDSVKTLKALQSITQVFDPFLPNKAGVNPVLDVNVLAAVNLLKSPKVEETNAG
jgi:uncharacterized protein (UPF0218 family)